MRLQVHQMLYIERGGEVQLADDLATCNPLIPQDSELSATVMFEINDPVRCATTLARLGGVENHVYIDMTRASVRGIPDPPRENTSSGGEASSVQFVKF